MSGWSRAPDPLVKVLDAPASFISFDVDGDVAGGFRFSLFAVEGAGGTAGVALFLNDDTEVTNYDTTYHGIVPANTVVTGGPNTTTIGNIRANTQSIIEGTLFCRQGAPRPFRSISTEPQGGSSAPVGVLSHCNYRVTNTKITKVRFSTTGTFGVGTTAILTPIGVPVG